MKLIKYNDTCECGSKIALVYKEDSRYYHVNCLGCSNYWIYIIGLTEIERIMITWNDNTVFKFLKKLYDA